MSDVYVIKRHSDVITVPEALRELCNSYKALGYSVSEPFANTFKYWLEDGTTILVYWQNGVFFEEIQS